jgi:uncharacterized protein (TIGR03118 family)
MRKAVVSLIGLSAMASPAWAKPVSLNDSQLDAVTAGTNFSVTAVVSNQPGVASNTDPNLVNAWGAAQLPNGPLWVADNGSGKSTVYGAGGVPTSLVVTVPPAPGGTGTGTPTGLAANSNNDFVVQQAGRAGASRFIFASEDGAISGWNPQVNATTAVVASNQAPAGSVYKGATIAQQNGRDFLYAANFSGGRIDVFDQAFKPVSSFTDPTIPVNYAPFNVKNINGSLYVTYAKRATTGTDEVAGLGNGFVDVFNTNGTLQTRLASNGTLNAPWGMAIAPNNFGDLKGALLVGNFGDGRINAYDPKTGQFKGQLTGSTGQPIVIDGVWALATGRGGPVGTNTLVFTAGPNSEKNGLVGTVRAIPGTTGAQAAVAQTQTGTAKTTATQPTTAQQPQLASATATAQPAATRQTGSQVTQQARIAQTATTR